MKNIFNTIKILTILIVLAIGASYAFAQTAAGSVPLPVHTGFNQVKDGSLSVGSFVSYGKALLDGTPTSAWFETYIRGGNTSSIGTTSKVSIGGFDSRTSELYTTSLIASGDVRAAKSIFSSFVASPQKKELCADVDGTVIWCDDTIDPPAAYDACLNIAGIQTTVPSLMEDDGNGGCVFPRLLAYLEAENRLATGGGIIDISGQNNYYGMRGAEAGEIKVQSITIKDATSGTVLYSKVYDAYSSISDDLGYEVPITPTGNATFELVFTVPRGFFMDGYNWQYVGIFNTMGSGDYWERDYADANLGLGKYFAVTLLESITGYSDCTLFFHDYQTNPWWWTTLTQAKTYYEQHADYGDSVVGYTIGDDGYDNPGEITIKYSRTGINIPSTNNPSNLILNITEIERSDFRITNNSCHNALHL